MKAKYSTLKSKGCLKSTFKRMKEPTKSETLIHVDIYSFYDSATATNVHILKLQPVIPDFSVSKSLFSLIKQDENNFSFL